MDARTRGRTYLEHLSPADRQLLARMAGDEPAAERPERVEALLAAPALYEAVFPRDAEAEPFVGVSPFLVFAVALQRSHRDLDERTYLQEWTGPRQRVPVFVTDELRAFLAEPDHLLFLTELLGSYTHVASGAVTTHRHGTVHRQRFSELDLTSLARLLEVADEEARPGIYRRLGDLTLLLTGVFPDHTARHGLAPVEIDRLARTLQPGGLSDSTPLTQGLAAGGAVGVLERLGPRWYELAVRTASVRTHTLARLEAIGAQFMDARRVLNHLTDQHLFPFRAHWFPSSS